MNYKVGDKVTNGAGNICIVKKGCLQCKTLVDDKGKGYCKCYMRRSCPGWGSNEPKPNKTMSYVDTLNEVIKEARKNNSDSIIGLVIAKSIYESLGGR